jgi:DNA-binding transcriptional LysR family regulator
MLSSFVKAAGRFSSAIASSLFSLLPKSSIYLHLFSNFATDRVMRWNDRIGRRIKLSDLHILLAVAQSGSMTKAANELAISHPVVSRSISDLEHTLGVRLLERNARGIELTEYGRAMLNRSNAAFDELRQAVKDIEFLADPTAGEVRIGGTAPLVASFVSTVVSRLHQRYPRMVFHVVTGSADPLLRDLNERNLDLLILRKIGAFAEDRLSFEVLYDDPYVVAAGAQNPWARRRRVELADLIGELWVLPPEGSRFGSLVRDIFGVKGLPCPRAAVIAYGVEMTVNLLRTGRYLAIHPQSVLTFPSRHPFVRKVPVDLPIVSGPIGILTLKNRVLNPAARLFIECAREVAKPVAKKQ